MINRNYFSSKIPVILVFISFLFGCSGIYGPQKIDQIELELAHREASTTLDRAKKFNVHENYHDLVTDADELFQETFKKHKSSPSDELIKKYERVISLSNEAIIKTRDLLRDDLSKLREKNNDNQSKIQKLQKRVSKLDNKIEFYRTKLQQSGDTFVKLRSTIDNLKNRYQNTKKKLEKNRSKVKELRLRYDEILANSIGRLDFQKLPIVIRFNKGSAKLNPSYKWEINTVIDKIKKTDRMIQVRGYPDPDFTTKNSIFDSDWDLATQRAVNVLKYLVRIKKVDESRLIPVGVGGSRMTEFEQPSDLNGRVEFLVYPPGINIQESD